jgi:hypothetical protein
MISIENIEDHHLTKVGWLCRNLAPRDRDEILAVQFDDDPEFLTKRTMAMKNFAWLACIDGKPAGIFGAAPCWPGHWEAFAYGSEDYPKVIVPLTRHVRRFCVPALIHYHVRLVKCWVQASYLEARRWVLMAIPGAIEACLVQDFGRNGEDFVMITWRPQEAQNGQ